MDATPYPLRAPVLLAWFAVLIPCIPVILLLRRRRRKWLLDTLRSQHRLIFWAELEQRAQAEKGTVLLEIGSKAGLRFWWVAESVTATSPIPPLPFADLDLITGGGYVPPPFLKWCYDRYVDPIQGIVLLADPVQAPASRLTYHGFESYWREYFARAEVVFITFYDYRDP